MRKKGRVKLIIRNVVLVMDASAESSNLFLLLLDILSNILSFRSPVTYPMTEIFQGPPIKEH
jgi:hypothetical protein